ncbi:deaminase [Intrasporangium oryzae NRRL B-24470]|uniref:Deaminase n=1 Tax=Intrasporangium oryzae NRRL B-24470 TaxID=1386089 RepID=W9G3Y2_9MICO|nr:dihydrofolate reductase family protein [Intrasporangium oryzae]EWS99996.1 deaminase [Intrasporangium oryzae NRRL B-24470]
MARPHVVVYNEISIDGRIVGFDLDPGRYYRRGFRWHSDAILMGSVTAQAFGPPEPVEDQALVLPSPPRVPVYPGFEDLVYEPRPLLVVPDSKGAVRNWIHALAEPWYRSIVVLVSRSTPGDYIDYLDRRGIEHVVSGDERVDLASALATLAERHGVASVRTDSGGALNGALIAAGLVDEVALILNPHVSGRPEGQSVVRLPRPMGDGGIPLALVELERLDDDSLWLRYAVQP